MSRRKRRASPLQACAIAAVCILFALTTLSGLYKCFSQAPPQAKIGGSASAARELSEGVIPTQAGGDALLPAEERKENFYIILIAGLDDENGGSDANLLVALDAENKDIRVMSLPRDTLLNVSWTVKKLNNAYHQGGISRTRNEISNLLGIPVDGYVTVDLQAFVDLVDEIGGVDFDIPVDMDYDDPAQDLHIHFSAGQQHLTGQEALEVVRWRKNNDGTGYAAADISRIGTQQAFLAAMAQQTLQLSNLDKLPEMAKIFQERVDTDLKLENLIWLGEQVFIIGSDNISFYTLPGDGSGYYKGVSYYVLDPAAVLEMLNSGFNPYQRTLTEEDLDILVP